MKPLTPIILTLAALPAIAQAQAYQCQLPRGPVSVPRIERDGPVRIMPVSGYTLSLSWSPEYCRGRETRNADAMQCSGRNGRFGLVLHGLWPEGGEGRWPQWCPSGESPAPAQIRQNMCATPSARLLAHEWAKHGTCMVKRPETYFKVSQILWKSIEFPDLDRLSHKRDLDAGAIREAFVEANLAWKPEQVGIHLNSKGWFKEMRLCYGKNFMPKRCSRGQFGAHDSSPAKIWRGL